MVDDLIKIAGTALGGSSSRNDVTITVTDISALNEITTSLEFATDNIDRLSLQLQAQTVVDEISAIINESEFWDEEIFGGLRAIGYAQVGHKPSERKLIDIQELDDDCVDLVFLRKSDVIDLEQLEICRIYLAVLTDQKFYVL